MSEPTEAEIEAAAKALHEMLEDDHTMRGCQHMAKVALTAAARVRDNANRTGGDDE